MHARPFGASGLVVSALGFGAGHIGGPASTEAEIDSLLGLALDLGVTLFDTAPSYGSSEERLGRALSPHRARVVLSTKCGYGAPGHADWTGGAITANIDAALQRLQTDWIDILHLHSCPREVLAREDVLGALTRAREAGKVRVLAYSGEGEALAAALSDRRFGGVQASLNLCDQESLETQVARAYQAGVGFIAKRPLANAPWRFSERPRGHYAEIYWERLRAMNLSSPPEGFDDLALRFSVFAPGVSSAILGTGSAAHLRRAAEIVARGPLPGETFQQVRAAFAGAAQHWEGQV
jgi:aryl-alcohol dehydrogenase-like predicted oxidoreductase